MKHIKKAGLFTIFIFMISCKCSKEATKESNMKYEKEGYIYGVIEPQETGNCGWIITNKENTLYDPVNIENEKFTAFTSEKTKVYFKFLPLRRTSRCANTTPIEITEMVLYNKE